MPFTCSERPLTHSFLDTSAAMKPCTMDSPSDMIIHQIAPLSFDEMLSGRSGCQPSLRKGIRDRLDNVSPTPTTTSPTSPSSAPSKFSMPNFEEGRKRAYSAPSVLNICNANLTPILEEEEEVAISSNMLPNCNRNALTPPRKMPETREHRSHSDAALMPRYRKINPSPLSGRLNSKLKDRKTSSPDSC